jgi:thiol-disulfide isomerase/thioredoxin
MKKIILIAILFITQTSQATWLTSFEDAQKMALATNKFIIVDFWATWCKPCLEMDKNVWNDPQIQEIMQGFVNLKIDIDTNKDLANRYFITGVPNIMIIDANGKIVHSFIGSRDVQNLKSEIEKFNLSTEFLSTDLLNFYNTKNFNTAIKTSLKYFDYSILINKTIKNNLLKTSNNYLTEAKALLYKKDKDYAKKKQKLDLYSLYDLAYTFNFIKLSKKLEGIKPEEIDLINEYSYWFLKYLATKGTDKSTTELEQKIKDLGLESVINKSNQLFSFYEPSK